MANKLLQQAKRAKKDEFYTRIEDVANELHHYRDYFRGKSVLCNCDDPYESNFFKYFALNFNAYGLRKLVATCYDGSPVAGSELSINFDDKKEGTKLRTAYKIEIVEVPDLNGDGATDMTDVDLLIKNDRNVLTRLQGNGDFRSAECVEMLQQADVVVTNPPFSLFREYVAQLMQYDKKFLIIGNQNAITYKDIFPYIRECKVWLGQSISGGDRPFYVPNDYPLDAAGCGIDSNGRRYIRVKGVRWFTNIDHKKRHEPMDLYKKYSPEEFPKYDNYDAINVDNTADIPMDYYGVMGVPVTFMDKYCPDQFEILGNEYDLDIPKGRGYINGKRKYGRIFIKRK